MVTVQLINLNTAFSFSLSSLNPTRILTSPLAATMDLSEKYDDYDFPHTQAASQDGHLGYLTDAQIAQVHQLRMMLESEGYAERLDTLTMVRLID